MRLEDLPDDLPLFQRDVLVAYRDVLTGIGFEEEEATQLAVTLWVAGAEALARHGPELTLETLWDAEQR